MSYRHRPDTKRRIKLGLCTKCGKPAELIVYKHLKPRLGRLCAEHRKWNADRMRARLAAMPVEARRARWRQNTKRWQDSHPKYWKTCKYYKYKPVDSLPPEKAEKRRQRWRKSHARHSWICRRIVEMLGYGSAIRKLSGGTICSVMSFKKKYPIVYRSLYSFLSSEYTKYSERTAALTDA